MTTESLKLYQSGGSPNSRRVRIFIAEKKLIIPTVAVDLGKGEQHAEDYRAINPRRVVPTLTITSRFLRSWIVASSGWRISTRTSRRG